MTAHQHETDVLDGGGGDNPTADTPGLSISSPGSRSRQWAYVSTQRDHPTRTVGAARQAPAVAVRTEAAVKVYGSGEAAVRPRRRLGRHAHRALHRGHGSVRLRQVHPHALPGRARRPTSGSRLRRRPRARRLTDKQLTRLRRDRLGFVFQTFNLLPVLTAENITLPMGLAGRKPDAEWLDRGDRHRRPRRPAEAPALRALRRAAAAGRRGPGAGHQPGGDLRRRADRQPGLRAGGEVLGFLRRAVDEMGQTVVMVTHDPAAAYCRPRAVPRRRPPRRGHGRPHRRAGPRADEVLRELTMFRPRSRASTPTSAGCSARASPWCWRRLPQGQPGARRHAAPASATCSARSTPAPTSWSACDRDGLRPSRRGASSRRPRRRPCAAVDGVLPPSRRSRSGQILGRRRHDRRRRRPPSPATGSPTPASTRGPRRRPGIPTPRRGGHRPRPPPRRHLSDRRHDYRPHARGDRGRGGRHRHVRPRRQPAPSPSPPSPPRRAGVLMRRPTRSRGSRWRPTRASTRSKLVERSIPVLPYGSASPARS